MRFRASVVITLSLSVAAGLAQQLPTLNSVPSRVIGRPPSELNDVFSANPNLVEGREFAGPRGIAMDRSTSPPILYVSDTGNNRVLAWKDAAGFRNGQPADLAIGQIDHSNFFLSVISAGVSLLSANDYCGSKLRLSAASFSECTTLSIL